MTWIRILRQDNTWTQPQWINYSKEAIIDLRELVKYLFREEYPHGKDQNFDPFLFVVAALGRNGIRYNGAQGYFMYRCAYEPIQITERSLFCDPKLQHGLTLGGLFSNQDPTQVRRPKRNTQDILRKKKSNT